MSQNKKSKTPCHFSESAEQQVEEEHKSGNTVYDWLGMTKEEFDKKTVYGLCVVCGKDAVTRYASLCIGHKIAYRRWRNKRIREERAKTSEDECEKCEKRDGCLYTSPIFCENKKGRGVRTVF